MIRAINKVAEGVVMSFRVIHHAGSREELTDKVRDNLSALHEEYSEDYDDGFWDEQISKVLNNDFSDEEDSAEVTSRVINFLFKPVSEDWKLNAYDDLANKTTEKLKDLFTMFMDGRNLATGTIGFGDESTCGYLDPAEVEEALAALKSYTPDETVEWEKEFIDSLIETMSLLANTKSGDLFIMS
jgi:hypothetical protein